MELLLMPQEPFAAVLDHLRKIYARQKLRGLSDAELLQQFLAERDEASFAALVHRHGSSVMGVCQRVLGDVHEAEDAFQATFMVLVRRAASVRREAPLSNWLCGVAQRVALNARARAAARQRRQRELTDMPRPEPLDEPTWQELRPVLDEEISRLPKKLRAAIVLCYFEGKSYEQAGKELGWPKSTLASRLARARDLLRQRLVQRGITLTAGALTTSLAEKTGGAAVGAMLAIKTAKAAAGLAAGKTVAETVLSAQALALAEEAMKGMLAINAKLIVMVLAIGVTVGGMGVAGYRGAASLDPAEATPPPPRALQVSAPTRDQPAPQPQTGGDSQVDSFGDPLPPGVLFRLGTIRMRQGGAPKSVAWSPDGQRVVCASSGIDWAARIFEVDTGKEVLAFQEHRNRAQAATFSPDGRSVLSRDEKGLMYLWDAVNGKVSNVRDTPLPKAVITFAADGGTVAAIDPQGQACLIEVPSLQIKRVFNTDVKVPVAHVALSRDGKSLIAAEAINAIWCYDTESGSVKWKTAFPGEIRVMGLSGNGTLLAAAGQGKGVRICSAASGKMIRELAEQERPITSIDWSPDDKTLATMSTDNTARLWDVETGKEKMKFVHPHAFAAGQGNVPSVAFSPNGTLLASIGMDGDNVVHIWSVQTGKEVLSQDEHLGFVSALAVLDQGKTLLTSGADDSIRLWDLATGKLQSRFRTPHYRAQAIAVTADGKRMAAGTSDGTIRFLELPSGKFVSQFSADNSQIANLAFSPDAKRLVSSSNNSKLLLWDVDAGKLLKQLNHPKEPIQTVAFSSDGNMFCTGSNKGFVALWDGRTGEEIARLQGHTDRVDCVRFFPDNKFVVSISIDGTTRVWDVSTAKVVRQLPRPGPQFATAITPDSRMLATVGGDSFIRLWELATGQERAKFPYRRGRIWTMTFLNDGKTLITGCADSTALCWDVTGRDRQHVVKPLSAEESQTEWDQLFGRKADRAYEALWTLVEHPEQTLENLKKELQPSPKVDAKQIKQWIADLDADEFDVREKASDALRKAGDMAWPAMKKALENPPSFEVKTRLTQLLQNDPLQASDQQLRMLRSLELLEHLQTPEARRFVESLAGGAPESWLTREAKGILKRKN
jgi:RNA polymerase sigma factor (sigma-70 family)